MAGMIRGAEPQPRPRHITTILETRPETPWFEALAGNYLNPGEAPHRALSAAPEIVR